MEYIKIQNRKKAVRLYPLVCMHLGAQQCDEKFIKEHVYRAKHDPDGLVVYMGDGGECVTKLSKGDVYAQTMSPQEQIDECVEIMKPIRNKLLFGIRGNHGNRVYKETGVDFDKNLCERLGMPYLGASTFMQLVVGNVAYDTFWHHGIDSGAPLVTKVRRAETFSHFIDADAIFTAHSHVAMELQQAALLFANNKKHEVGTKLRSQYICGSGYDSRSGYAEDKGYPPLLPSYIEVEFSGVEPKQSCKIYRADGKPLPRRKR
jgi:hypothetical protein